MRSFLSQSAFFCYNYVVYSVLRCDAKCDASVTQTFEFSVTFVGKRVYLFVLQFLTCVTESVTESVTELFFASRLRHRVSVTV